MHHRTVIRGAISVVEDSREAIYSATMALFRELIQRNQLSQECIQAIFFTATPDLTTAYPAAAVRAAGWDQIPMLCMQEMAVQDSLPKILRMMVFTYGMATAPRHVYLGEAEKLRPDLVEEVQNAGN